MFENVFVGIVAAAEENTFFGIPMPEHIEIILAVVAGVIILGMVVIFIARGYFKEVKKIEAARAAQEKAAKEKAAKKKDEKKTGDKKKKK